MQKKPTDKFSKKETTASTSPYKKVEKRKKNPVLVAAAQRMFDRSVASKDKKFERKKFEEKGKLDNDIIDKKFLKSRNV